PHRQGLEVGHQGHPRAADRDGHATEQLEEGVVRGRRQEDAPHDEGATATPPPVRRPLGRDVATTPMDPEAEDRDRQHGSAERLDEAELADDADELGVPLRAWPSELTE